MISLQRTLTFLRFRPKTTYAIMEKVDFLSKNMTCHLISFFVRGIYGMIGYSESKVGVGEFLKYAVKVSIL